MTARLWSWIAGVALILGFLAGLYAYGRADGREAQRKDDAAEIARVKAKLADAGKALGAAAVRLNADAALFRRIDAEGAAAMVKAARDQADAEAAAKDARKGQQALQARIDQINRARDNSPCRDTTVGVPLN